MKFKQLSERLKIYETAHDFCVPPNIFIIARIDGRGFSNLTKKKHHNFSRPFDEQFRDCMIETTIHLMNSGFKVNYGYTQSDEISLLFDINEGLFSRKTRKLNSILAGEASAKFSLTLGDLGAFDCRISQLPRTTDVVDYFTWRSEDAHRNSLNAHCYWLLRKQGKTARQATMALENQTNSFKNELLFQNGINYNDLPNWQKRGIGFFWTDVEKKGWNPIEKKNVITSRKVLQTEMNLPIGEEYRMFINQILDKER